MKENHKPTSVQPAFDKPRALAECLPKNRAIDSGAYFPVVINFDTTGNGMCNLPQFFWQDVPELVDKVKRTLPALFEDLPTFYFTGIGDIKYDFAPLQVTTGSAFTTESIRNELSKLWLEQGGGGGTEIENLCESHEMMAYFLAKRFSAIKTTHRTYPTCIFVTDEAPRSTLEKAELDWYFGGKNADTDAETVFAELKRRFNDNVFLIFRHSFGTKENNAILTQWRALIGDDKILLLPNDRLITAAIRELIIVVAANHPVSYAQNELNELAPKVAVPEHAPITLEPEHDPTTPKTAPQKRPKKAQPSDDWRLQPKITEPLKKRRKTKTAKPSDAFRL